MQELRWKENGKSVDKWKFNGYNYGENGKIMVVWMKEEYYDTIRDEREKERIRIFL